MCQHIVKFCTDSAKPLLYVGGACLTISALALGYLGHSSHSLYQDLDQTIALDKSLCYHLQLAGALYLILSSILCFFAVFYDHKHSIRAVAILTALNFVLATAAILMTPAGTDVGLLFNERLNQARDLYDFTEKYPSNQTTNTLEDATARALNLTQITKRSIGGEQTKVANSTLTKQEATKLWDRLQARGCCGFRNATEEWKNKIPKSCCLNASEIGSEFTCKALDEAHNRPCIEVISSTSFNLLIVLALIALVNLYLATVTGVSAYRTFHYSEASQTAYS